MHKGDKLYVEGKIRTRSYDDQGGIKRYVTEIFVDNMEMLTPRTATPGASPYAPQAGAAPQPQQPVQPQAAPAQDNPTDDLPF